MAIVYTENEVAVIYARGPIESRLCPRFNLLLARTLLLVRKVNRDAINDTCALGGVRAISRDEGFNLFAPFFFSLSLSFALPFLYYVTSSANFFSFSSFSCEIPREVSRYMLKMLGNRKMHVRARISSLLLLFFSPLAGKFQFLEQVFTRVEAFARRSKSVRE